MNNRSFGRVLGLLVLAVLGSGCAAQMMETHGGTIQLIKSGQEKPGHGGVVRYLSNGLAVVTRARRSDAEKQMRGFCGGDYKVTAEGPRSKFGASMPIGPKVSVELDQYWYVAFECDSPAR